MRFPDVKHIPAIRTVFRGHDDIIRILTEVMDNDFSPIPLLTQFEIGRHPQIGKEAAAVISKVLGERSIPQRQPNGSIIVHAAKLYGTFESAPVGILQLGKGSNGWNYLQIRAIRRIRLVEPTITIGDLVKLKRSDVKTLLTGRHNIQDIVLNVELNQLQQRLEDWGQTLVIPPVVQMKQRTR